MGYTMCPCCGEFETIDDDLCAYCEEAGCDPSGESECCCEDTEDDESESEED